MFPASKRNRIKRIRTRRGAPAVECAFCLPMVLLFMFATLEVCSALFVKESLTISCYEGCRVGVLRGATRQDVIDQCDDFLQKRGVVNATVEVFPADFTGLKALDPVRVRITAPSADNSFFVGKFMEGKSIQSEVSMAREFDE